MGGHWPDSSKETLEKRHFGAPVTREHLQHHGSTSPGSGFPKLPQLEKEFNSQLNPVLIGVKAIPTIGCVAIGNA